MCEILIVSCSSRRERFIGYEILCNQSSGILFQQRFQEGLEVSTRRIQCTVRQYMYSCQADDFNIHMYPSNCHVAFGVYTAPYSLGIECNYIEFYAMYGYLTVTVWKPLCYVMTPIHPVFEPILPYLQASHTHH